DVLEPVVVHETVGAVGGIVPRVHEVARFQLRAVVERPVVPDGDGKGLIVLGFDGFGDVVLGFGALGVVAHELGENSVENVAAVDLVGVTGDEWVLRLATVDRHRSVASLFLPGGTCCEEEGHGRGDGKKRARSWKWHCRASPCAPSNSARAGGIGHTISIPAKTRNTYVVAVE